MAEEELCPRLFRVQSGNNTFHSVLRAIRIKISQRVFLSVRIRSVFYKPSFGPSMQSISQCPCVSRLSTSFGLFSMLSPRGGRRAFGPASSFSEGLHAAFCSRSASSIEICPGVGCLAQQSSSHTKTPFLSRLTVPSRPMRPACMFLSCRRHYKSERLQLRSRNSELPILSSFWNPPTRFSGLFLKKINARNSCCRSCI